MTRIKITLKETDKGSYRAYQPRRHKKAQVGNSIDEAIGRFVRSHPDLFGIDFELKPLPKPSRLVHDAAWVVNMFDSANTGKAIENMPGGKGEALQKAIEDLRQELNRKSQTTILTTEQANS